MASTSLESGDFVAGQFQDAGLVGTAGVFYKDPDDVRFELSLVTAETWRDAGLPYVVVDASPTTEAGDWVAQAHRNRQAIVLPADIPGIATQRQQGVRFAVEQGAAKVVGHEPEKTTVPSFAADISYALDDCDVLVIGRTELAENSLPPVQQRTERLAGWVLERTHGLPVDALAGPRGFTVAGAEVLADYPAIEPGMNNWIYMYNTPLAARRQGLAIGGLALDMVYPESMVDEETGSPVFDAKRYDQFVLQLNYLLEEDHDQIDFDDDAPAIAAAVRRRLPEMATGSLWRRSLLLRGLEIEFAENFGYRATDRWPVQ